MHELSVCEDLIDQVVRLAHDHGASRVARVVVAVGPLSGVEPELLARAYTLARAGTVAQDAALEVEVPGVVVRCRGCGATSEVGPQRLVCATCGDWRTTVISGQELLLASVELVLPDAAPVGLAPLEGTHV